MEQAKRYHSEHRRAEYKRLEQKTREEGFIESLHREFELSPRESRGVLELVSEQFFDNRERRDGQIEYVGVSAEEGAGKTIEEMKKVRVILTKDLPSDIEVESRKGESARRVVQILRITEEAYDQGSLLT